MRFSVSNIAWQSGQDDAVHAVLARHGFTGIEVAPTRLWPGWQGAEPDAAAAWREALAQRGLHVPALQSLCFGQSGMSVFGPAHEQHALQDHLRRVGELAAGLGARHLVFGSPGLRNRGSLSEAEAMVHGARFFAEAASRLEGLPVVLCIEPNPPQYGCNFVTTAAEGAALVRAVAHPHFQLHLDVAGMTMAGDDVQRSIEDQVDVLAHVHASEPGLGGFAEPQADHAGAARALRNVGWQGWVSIEMRAESPEVERVAQACERVAALYA